MSLNQKETKAWHTFEANAAGRSVRFVRVENQLGNGTPDVKGINRKGVSFWVENKALDGWPARASTLPLAGSFEPGQVPFLRSWRDWGGKSFVLLRVEKEYLLLHPKDKRPGAKDLRESTQAELRQFALAVGMQSIINYMENLSHED